MSSSKWRACRNPICNKQVYAPSRTCAACRHAAGMFAIHRSLLALVIGGILGYLLGAN